MLVFTHPPPRLSWSVTASIRLRPAAASGLNGSLSRRYEDKAFMSLLAVCHEPCGLLEVKLSDGTYLVEGKDVTGFLWKEEKLANRNEAVPSNLGE